MKIRVRAMTEGAVLLALFMVLLLFALYAPFIGTILLFVLPLPFIIFTIRHGVSLSIMLLLLGSFLSILFGSVSNILVAFTFGLSGLTMGAFYRKKKTASALAAGSLAYIASIVITYVGTILFLQIDIIKDSVALMQSSIEQSKTIITSLNPTADIEKQMDQFEKGLELVHTLIPTMFVVSGVIFAFITHLLATPVLKRLKINISKLKPFKDWRLPQSLVWYYLIVSILMMINLKAEGFFFMAVINLYFILQFFILIQGYSFIYYYSSCKGISKAFPIIIVVTSLLIPILLYLVRILGIIDLAFPLRNKINKKET